MTMIRKELPKDIAAREALLDLSLGDERFTKPSERLREGRRPAEGLAFTASDRGRVVGTVRLWDVSAGPGRPALLLGPLAVDPDVRGRGIGSALMGRAIEEARRLGHRAVLLVGDAPYYARFGFSAEPTQELWLPGRYDPARFLALELADGALAGARGLVNATGRPVRRPSLTALVAAASKVVPLAPAPAPRPLSHAA